MYFINLHVGGKLVRDPHLRYDGGTILRIEEDPDTICYYDLCEIVQKGLLFNTVEYMHYYKPGSKSFDDGLRLIWNDSTTLDMLKIWMENGEIDLYIEHKIDISEPQSELNEHPVNNAIELGPDIGVENAADSEVEKEDFAADIGVEIGAESVSACSNQPEIDNGSDDEDNVYMVKVRYLSDGENDEELQAARENLRKYNERANAHFVNVERATDDESDPLIRARHKTTLAAEQQNQEGYESEYYDSSDHGSLLGSDEEDDSGTRRKSRFLQYNPNVEVPEFCLGMVFADNVQFREAIRKYSRYARRELQFVKNEPKRIQVHCIAAANCPWRIYASYNKVTRGIQVKTFQEEHSCAVSFHNKLVNQKMIAEHCESTLKTQPKIKSKEIQSKIRDELKVNVNLTVCKRAKRRVFEKLAGNFEEEYSLLRDYAGELLEKNPGSTIIVKTDRVTPESPLFFRGFYICFDALKKAWKIGCRPIICLDGCFLKSQYKGELLSAIGRDGNDQMFPLAWAVVDVECTESWTWFLQILQSDLDLRDGTGFTIMSDKQKGLKNAIDDLMPRVEHRNCARHVFANWNGRRRPKSYEFTFWEIVKATTERQWEDKLEALAKLDKEAKEDLMSKSPKHWTRAFFGTHCKSDMVDNNMCEAFNSSILDARHKSIITMLEEIRVKVMTRIVEKRQFVLTWRNGYGPLIKEKFDKQKKEGVEWEVFWSDSNGCEVKKGKRQFTVNIKKEACSCRSWQISGIPCAHACCAIWHNGGDPNKYLSKWYHPNTYIKAYQYSLQPINGSHEWKKSSLEQINPPVPRKSAGRPKINRRKSKNEPKKNVGKIGRTGMIMTCRLCGVEGHNKRSCPQRMPGVGKGGNQNCQSIQQQTMPLASPSTHPQTNPSTQPQARLSTQSPRMLCVSDGGNQARKITSTKPQMNKNKEKEKIVDSVGRPTRNRRPSLKGYGLYTNVNTGEQTFYSGMGKNISISSGRENRKRKTTTENLGTQESVVKKKN